MGKLGFLVMLELGCAASATALAGAGLTSAGVDQTQNVPQQEPTLAQVEPMAPGAATQTQSTQTTATATNAINAGGVAGVVNANNAQETSQEVPRAAAAAAVVVPPPPPDPATLPVSVLHPLNKAGMPQVDAATPDSVSTQTSTARPVTQSGNPPATRRSLAATARTPVATSRAVPSTSMRLEPTRVAAPAGTAPIAESGTAAESEGSSGSTIFYSGIGITGLILAISFGLFRRASKAEAAALGGR
jgi:hypothetical protein